MSVDGYVHVKTNIQYRCTLHVKHVLRI